MNTWAKIIDIAIANAVQINEADNAFKKVQALLSGADVAYGVWFEPDVEGMYGILLVKGQHQLGQIAHDGLSRGDMKVTAILCDCPEHAEALRQMLGEKVH